MPVEQAVGYGFTSKVVCGIEVKFNKRAKKLLNALYTSVHLQQNEIKVYVLFFVLVTLYFVNIHFMYQFYGGKQPKPIFNLQQIKCLQI